VIRLVFFDGSNACKTATLMLAHKRLDYEPVRIPPGAHAAYLKARGFPRMTAPAMTVDGRKVQGSREIARALEEIEQRWPLFPADPAKRTAVEEAERWGEDFQNAARRVFYCAMRRDPRGFNTVMGGQFSRPVEAGVRLATRGIIRAASFKHGAVDERGRADLERLPAFLDRIDGWLEEGLLGGDELNAADFQIAPSVRAMLLSEDLAPFAAERPAGAWALRVVPDYAGHVRAVLPPAWLEPLTR
jgi:glutathione S-transferase